MNTVFLLITYCRYTYISLQRNKSLRSHKTVEIEVFLIFFCFFAKDPDPYTKLRIWTLKTHKLTDPTAPDRALN